MRIPLNFLKVGLIAALITVTIITSTTFLTAADYSKHQTNKQINNKTDDITLSHLTTPTNSTGLTHHLFLPLITYSSYFTATVRKLTACENQGRHHLFIQVINSNGEGISNIPVKVAWSPIAGGNFTVNTNDEGKAEFEMFKGDYWAELETITSEIAGPVSNNIDKVEICEITGETGNSLYNNSYEIIFRQAH